MTTMMKTTTSGVLGLLMLGAWGCGAETKPSPFSDMPPCTVDNETEQILVGDTVWTCVCKKVNSISWFTLEGVVLPGPGQQDPGQGGDDCETPTPDPSPTPPDGLPDVECVWVAPLAAMGKGPKPKVTICHVGYDDETGEVKLKTKKLPLPAAVAHLAHHPLDYEGACVEPEPEPSPEPSLPPSPEPSPEPSPVLPEVELWMP